MTLVTQAPFGFILRLVFVSIVLLDVDLAPLMWLAPNVLIRITTSKLMEEHVLLTVQQRRIKKRLQRRDVWPVPRTVMHVIPQGV